MQARLLLSGAIAIVSLACGHEFGTQPPATGSGSGGTAGTSTTTSTTGGQGGSGGVATGGSGGTAAAGSGGTSTTSTGGEGGTAGAGGTVNVAPPSCLAQKAGADASCGTAKNDDCCASLAVPAGTFYRSYDGEDYPDKGFPASVGAFHLDRYEVTVGRFRQFLLSGHGVASNPPPAGSGAHPANPGSGWSQQWSQALAPDTKTLLVTMKGCTGPTWTDTPGGKEYLPIDCVTWFEAFAFCVWDEARLPSEAEWNYAAAGGSEQRVYPWSVPPESSAITPAHAVYDNASFAAVGSRSPTGDGRWGHADLAGNVWEWVLDSAGDYPLPCNDCVTLGTDDAQRGRRGGSRFSDAAMVRTSVRGNDPPEARQGFVGLRCARDP